MRGRRIGIGLGRSWGAVLIEDLARHSRAGGNPRCAAMLDSRLRGNDGAVMITINAQPTPFSFDPAHTALVMIDMQRDFIEPGGFGATLGNDVSLLEPVVPAAAELIAWCRANGVWVIHTQECHRPDLSDCPPAKRLRGK